MPPKTSRLRLVYRGYVRDEILMGDEGWEFVGGDRIVRGRSERGMLSCLTMGGRYK